MQYGLECAGTYQCRQPIVIHFSLQNLSDETIRVLKWLTSLKGIRGRIFKGTCDGQEIPCHGPLVSRIGPFKSDFIRIGPHALVSSQVDFSAAYNLQAGSECSVSFSGLILNVLRGETLKLEEDDSPASMDIPGNSLSARIAS